MQLLFCLFVFSVHMACPLPAFQHFSTSIYRLPRPGRVIHRVCLRLSGRDKHQPTSTHSNMVNAKMKLYHGAYRGALSTSGEFGEDCPEMSKRAARISLAWKGQEGAVGVSLREAVRNIHDVQGAAGILSPEHHARGSWSPTFCVKELGPPCGM